MDNQHRKITGYRELTQAEIDLMNEIKAKGQEFAALLSRAEDADCALHTSEKIDSAQYCEATRWRSIAMTHLQQGLMALTRSVAKPEFF